MANRYIDKNAGDDVYKYIMELIPQTDDLNIFLQKIYMRYNMPVIVTDIAFHLIAYGAPTPAPTRSGKRSSPQVLPLPKPLSTITLARALPTKCLPQASLSMSPGA